VAVSVNLHTLEVSVAVGPGLVGAMAEAEVFLEYSLQILLLKLTQF
jgi:hypothetical protein